MKKVLIFILLLFVVFMFGCSDRNTEKDNDKENNNKIKLEYKEYKSRASFFRLSSKVNNFRVIVVWV